MAGRSESGSEKRVGPRMSSRVRPAAGVGSTHAFRLDVNHADEAQALARDRADQLLLLAAVAHRPARRIDTGGQGRIGHDAPAPHGRDEIILAHHAVAIFHEMNQKIEHLRLDRDRFGAAPQLAPVCVKYLIGKKIFHVCALQAGP
jgi:hypothetical protein